jgi:hypothetical protein
MIQIDPFWSRAGVWLNVEAILSAQSKAKSERDVDPIRVLVSAYVRPDPALLGTGLAGFPIERVIVN